MILRKNRLRSIDIVINSCSDSTISSPIELLIPVYSPGKKAPSKYANYRLFHAFSVGTKARV